MGLRDSEKSDGLNLPKAEEKILEFWEKHGIFHKSLEKTQKGKPFTFYDGPPFATGLPHYGHILASTIKDVVPRYQTMKGRFVRRRWGWDCHGLPIEEIVERKLGISGKKDIEKIGIKKFNETCRSMVLEYVGEWRKMIRRMARWVEFDDSYKTMDADYMESVWWAFKEIYKKGLVYEGRRVLMYCPRCETPVSNFEVAMDNSYKDVTEEAVTAEFKIRSGKFNGAYLLAWTTTPWTLPGNVALAVGEKIKYAFVLGKQSGEHFFVAEELAKKVFAGSEYEIQSVHSGKDLVGFEYEPLFEVPAIKSDKSYKVYAADFVTTTEGTGIVHTAVVYGEDDYNLGVKVGLPVVPLLDEKGKFNDKAPEFLRGEYFKKADPLVIVDLEKRDLLFQKEKYTHSYPHCWRCGTPLFYNAIPAWFINIQKIKKGLLKSNDKEVNWFPEHLKHGRYEKSVEAAPDWNISRNRYWGNPIPIWKCLSCEKVEAAGSLDELSKLAGGPKNNYWVMRHGEGENNIFNVIAPGVSGFHLTPLGKKETEAGAKKFEKALKKEKIDLIISSDITRTKETAEIDSKLLGGVKVIFDKRLREIQLGPTLAGCHDSKYHELYPTHESKFENRPKEGESLRDLRGRMWDFLRDTESTYRGKNILLVSHEYSIWMMMHVALGWSEKWAIAEKVRRGDDFVTFAEVEKLDMKVAPRNDTGLIDLHMPYIDEVVFPCVCGGTMSRVPEIFDSWVEAGSMPFAEYHYPFENKKTFESRFPGQFVAEYIAQTRAWFYVMHVISFIIFGKAPFENVVTTGNVLNEKGEKLSKSKQNYTDPWITINKYGADALRFQLMNSVAMQSDDLYWVEKDVDIIYRKASLILLNVHKYFEMYAPTADSSAPTDSQKALDAWITVRTAELVRSVTELLDAYDTVHATRAIQDYIDDLSTWYLRRSRRRKDAAFFKTMRESLLTVSKIIAPFMPFLAEELYRALRAGDAPESVHLAEWPVVEARSKKQEAGLIEAMAEVRRLASLALAKRVEAKIKVRQPLAELRVKRQAPSIMGQELIDILKDEINVKKIVFDSKAEREEFIEFDTTITPELKEEGTLRELVRMVQELRQKAGLKPKDKIVLMMEAEEPVRGIVLRNESFIKSEVGAKEIEYKKSDKFGAEESSDIDGGSVWLGLRKTG